MKHGKCRILSNTVARNLAENTQNPLCELEKYGELRKPHESNHRTEQRQSEQKNCQEGSE